MGFFAKKALEESRAEFSKDSLEGFFYEIFGKTS